LFGIPVLDVCALVLFIASWSGYAVFAEHKAKHAHSLLGEMRHYRGLWMSEIISRDNRMVDAAILANLANGAAFFVSTTLLILGGLLALLGTTEKAVSVVSELPFTTRASGRLWEVKIVLLLMIFVYGFFKFTWALRQYNFCSILVGAAPPPGVEAQEVERFAARAARVVTLAGENFNNGLRAYYFGLAALAWVLHPWLLVAATGWVIAILYRRELGSRTLKALMEK
jgi:uncharacterized membrane protein